MAVRHSVITVTNCANCGNVYEYGYDIDEVKGAKRYLDIGDDLPLKDARSEGQWATLGTGDCPKCNKITEAECWFEGTKLVRVVPIPKLRE